MKQYLIIEGNVKSKADGQVLFISARQLIGLYSVPANECVILDKTQRHQVIPDGLVVLTPKSDGIYEVEEQK